MSLAKAALIRFVLRMSEPGGVTVPAPARRDDIDLALDRDPHGQPHLPGTTLAGGLRDLVRHYSGAELADALFGRLTPKNTGSDDVDAVASPIWVLGSRLLTDDAAAPPTPTTRTVTAIDRHRGAARNHTLHTDEILPAGTRFDAFLRWDDPDPDHLATFLAHLDGWRPLLGRGATRGRGSATVDQVTYGILDLGDPHDLLRWLTLERPDLVRTVAVTPGPTLDTADLDRQLLDTTVAITGPLRVGTGTATRDTDDGPDIARVIRAGDRCIIPGSSIKGILRSRCEYILRSVRAQPEPCTDQRCGHCWPCRIFGHGGGDNPAATSVGQRGRLRIPDTDITNPVLVHRQHVAVDRYTGGALDNHLYTVEAVEAGTFQLRVEALDLPNHHEPEVRALLRLVLADLADAIIGIGGATTRGYGTVTPDLATAESTGQLPTLAQARTTLTDMLTTTTRATA